MEKNVRFYSQVVTFFCGTRLEDFNKIWKKTVNGSVLSVTTYKEQEIDSGGPQIPSKCKQFQGLIFFSFEGFPILNNEKVLTESIIHDTFLLIF